MQTALVPVISENAITLEQGKAMGYIAQSKSAATLRGYSADLEDFGAWCGARGYSPLPASGEVVATYIADRADTLKPATLKRRIAAISQAHQAAGVENPTTAAAVRLTMQGIRREKGSAQDQVAPVVVDTLQAMVATLDGSLIGLRDRALLLIGFSGAFRRSELVSLDIEDVEVRVEGLAITLRGSKTDQDRKGVRVGIPRGKCAETCPVEALNAWVAAAGITSGPLFRSVNRWGHIQASRLSDYSVALVVKKVAESAGLDPANYAGHSLRAGLATSAAAAGADALAIMQQTRHRSVEMVNGYVREGNLFRANVAANVGL